MSEDIKRRVLRLIEFYKKKPTWYLYKMSSIKWKCVKRYYDRRSEISKYVMVRCPFCFNASNEKGYHKCEDCKIDHYICDKCGEYGCIADKDWEIIDALENGGDYIR